VKEEMGHARIQTTVDVYARLIQGANRNEVSRLDDGAFGGAELVQKAGWSAAGLLKQSAGQGFVQRRGVRRMISCASPQLPQA